MVSSLLLPGYELTEVIHEGSNNIIYRGISRLYGQKVILKILKDEYPSLEAIARLKHEYKVTENLDLKDVVKVLRLETHENRLALVLEDFDGQSLKQLLCTKKLEINSFISIAIQLVQALVSIHTNHIIHKDIKPGNIIINPETGVVKITDFSIASRLCKETPQLANPNQLEGTLAYISPEQTGRMNRSLDYRTDFYSLGVTFYEMLTGQLPFQNQDLLELVYCHIAQQPTEIERLNLEVPGAIVALVKKLMAKNAEDRYQTAKGILADLEICRKQLQTTGKISDFTPGRLDILSQLLIPQKLYGREAQVNLLLEAFERVSTGSRELVLVSGYSGIGKSSVVNEVNKPITRAKGFFISGKFDQFRRNIPYAPLIQAFSALIRQLLTESTSKLEEWRHKILASVGSNGQVIIDVIPEVELIIGKQPDVSQLTSTESQNRVNSILQKFISVFTQQDHPCVIFLDDLQWADSATLKLMQTLITNSDSKYLLIIGAYRDNEVSPTHPLIQTVNEIQQKSIIVNNIVLKELGLDDVTQLIASTLNDTTTKIYTLAELIYHKTAGNPFFLTQLLLALDQEKLLEFDFNSISWKWDIEEIQAIGITDKSVVEIVASRIQNLPETTQELLKFAACIGNRFTLDVLSIVTEENTIVIANQLDAALQSGLILPLNDSYRIPLAFNQEESAYFSFNAKQVVYKFLHDRVQQAAYFLIPDTQKQKTHVKIGNLLLEQTPSESLTEHILDIVNQLNYGVDLLSLQSEKKELAKLNLQAAKKAKLSAAYEASTKYLNVALQLLSIDSWCKDYELMSNLHIEAAESAFITGNFGQCNDLINITLEQANNITDQARIYQIKMQMCMTLNEMSTVIEIGLKFLEKLGIHLPNHPCESDFVEALLKTKSALEGIKIEKLILKPEMIDPHKLAAMPILMFVINAASQSGSSLLFAIAIFAMVRLSIEYGNSPISAFGYGVYGSILCDKLGDIETGYKFGKLATKLVLKTNLSPLKAKICFIFNGMIRYVKDPIEESNKDLLEGMHSGLENGDIEFGSYCGTIEALNLYFKGVNLESLDHKFRSYIDLARKLKIEALAVGLSIFRQTSLNLQEDLSHMSVLHGEVFNELTMISEVEKNVSYQGYLYSCKTLLSYFSRDYKSAIKNAEITSKIHQNNIGLFLYYVNTFYYSLSLLADLRSGLPAGQKEQHLNQVIANQKQMKQWAKHAPENFKHKYELVEAEKAKFWGKDLLAMRLYDSAISGAKENEYTQEEALANELAACFYLDLGKEKIAKVYMTDAYYGYIRWGAIAKVKDLDERYPNLIIRSEYVKQLTLDLTKTITATKTSSSDTTTSNHNILDLATVIKASQAISSEIILDKLLEKLLQIILENAAAQKGCLILLKNDELFVEAIKIQEASVILQSTPVDISQDIPISLINYVARTQENLVLDNAVSEVISQSDPYIQRFQSKSVLCSPIFYQSKFSGILYLENNLATGTFTSDRINILNLITSQVAISLENSQLYQQAQNYGKQLESSLSDLKQMQLQLVQSEKMSALGNLVSGIAHEINNPIGFLTGNLQPASDYVQDLLELIDLYQNYYPQPIAEITKKIKAIDLEYVREDLPRLIDSMQEGVNRIYDVSMSLRTFSRADTQKAIASNIHEVIDSTILILKHRLKASATRPEIQIVKSYGNLSTIQCFPGQLGQVFMNLIANAIDALEESNAGISFNELQSNPNTITVTTKINPDEKFVLIIIKDNGVGMTEEVKQHIFEHLFTTKPVGKGTGLGLAIVRQIIIEKHNGTIEVNSTLGQGSEFIIKLPVRV
ncbi:serine/threonine protein kinase [Dulcicalothrix desertica PCC 7102]|uniref:histidine kinase n=1 Tax=Dulcicalothrix desertica PCC 7102 TaxID=232991 RepID=A0A3S1CGP1_9CYAN|nr:ATP-binding sensor histidine kinase [Dulcicalothrix desertica]RUT06999.1 serine/threonine protein kinase [Dulcicalothrix desertica PCC 7102]TWH62000.1 putative ATPase [Dulcicalothrix desertica PCC 7102]